MRHLPFLTLIAAIILSACGANYEDDSVTLVLPERIGELRKPHLLAKATHIAPAQWPPLVSIRSAVTVLHCEAQMREKSQYSYENAGPFSDQGIEGCVLTGTQEVDGNTLNSYKVIFDQENDRYTVEFALKSENCSTNPATKTDCEQDIAHVQKYFSPVGVALNLYWLLQ